jgi:hypothetical protein
MSNEAYTQQEGNFVTHLAEIGPNVEVQTQTVETQIQTQHNTTTSVYVPKASVRRGLKRGRQTSTGVPAVPLPEYSPPKRRKVDPTNQVEFSFSSPSSPVLHTAPLHPSTAPTLHLSSPPPPPSPPLLNLLSFSTNS